MKNFWRVLIVVVSLLATYVGAMYATTEKSKSNIAQVNTAAVKAADWVKVEGNDFVSAYAAPATIIRAGNLAKMQSLVDFKTLNSSGGRPHMSMKAQHEYDCDETRWRLLDYTYHSGNMGGGEVVFSDAEPGVWMPVMVGSGTKIRWKIACGKQ